MNEANLGLDRMNCARGLGRAGRSAGGATGRSTSTPGSIFLEKRTVERLTIEMGGALQSSEGP